MVTKNPTTQNRSNSQWNRGLKLPCQSDSDREHDRPRAPGSPGSESNEPRGHKNQRRSADPVKPRAHHVGNPWPVSVHLGLMALVVALSGGLILGILSAVYQNTWIDYLASLSAIFSIVTPSFVIAVGLTLVFSLWLHWFDTGGWNSPKDWVMPVVAMALGDMAVIARYTRSNMIETIRADYVRTARAKGLTETSVVVVHVFKNALIPLLTITGPMMANLITGSFFIETIFRIPGLGRYFTTSVFARDYPMIMATALLWSSLIVVIYVLTDIMYALADPRIRYRKD